MNYEAERAARIAENQRRLKELGVLQTLQEMRDKSQQQSRNNKSERKRFRIAFKRKSKIPEVRRSRRLSRSKPVNFDEDVLFKETGLEDIMIVRRRSWTKSRMSIGMDHLSPYDSGLGVRHQGGRVYDSKHGVTCHWCRQKTLEDHVVCTSKDCGGGRCLPVSFCRMCLVNRHGEDVYQAAASGQWVCPKCRGSCGRGCKSCCNCGPCRKKHGLSPTHQIVKEARAASFTNVHDYLIHLSTGESQEKILERKSKFKWGTWLSKPCKEEESEASTDLVSQDENNDLQTTQKRYSLRHLTSKLRPSSKGKETRASRRSLSGRGLYSS